MSARSHRLFGRAVTVLLLLLGAGFLFLAGMVLFVYWQETHLPPIGEYEAIVVLGAQVKDDGTPSLALERRLTAALDAYLRRPCLVICCGAQGKDEPVAEGELMRSWLMERGVDPSRIVAETASFNTRQNLENAREVMDGQGLREALIVTSDYHVARALRLCAQVGLSATGLGSPSKPEYFLKNHIRESLSFIKFWMESLLR